MYERKYYTSKTREEVFFEKFPDAPKSEMDIPKICPELVGLKKYNTGCIYDLNGKLDCITCWKFPAPEKYQKWFDYTSFFEDEKND